MIEAGKYRESVVPSPQRTSALASLYARSLQQRDVTPASFHDEWADLVNDDRHVLNPVEWNKQTDLKSCLFFKKDRATGLCITDKAHEKKYLIEAHRGDRVCCAQNVRSGEAWPGEHIETDEQIDSRDRPQLLFHGRPPCQYLQKRQTARRHGC